MPSPNALDFAVLVRLKSQEASNNLAISSLMVALPNELFPSQFVFFIYSVEEWKELEEWRTALQGLAKHSKAVS